MYPHLMSVPLIPAAPIGKGGVLAVQAWVGRAGDVNMWPLSPRDEVRIQEPTLGVWRLWRGATLLPSPSPPLLSLLPSYPLPPPLFLPSSSPSSPPLSPSSSSLPTGVLQEWGRLEHPPLPPQVSVLYPGAGQPRMASGGRELELGTRLAV